MENTARRKNAHLVGKDKGRCYSGTALVWSRVPEVVTRDIPRAGGRDIQSYAPSSHACNLPANSLLGNRLPPSIWAR
jgi:hypothetical protein